jgi:hypothetical protein
MKTTTFQTEIKRESEKAILIEVSDFNSYGDERTSAWWLPKSKVNISGNDVTVPNWLVLAKIQDCGNNTYFTIGSKSFSKLDFLA